MGSVWLNIVFTIHIMASLGVILLILLHPEKVEEFQDYFQE